MKILVNEKLSEHKFKTPEGYLICTDAILARTGKQEYTRKEVFGDSEGERGDEIINVDRTPEEVFSEKTLASFENKPITIEHPDEDVTIDNYKDYAVGYVRDVKKGMSDGQEVIMGNLVITDKDAIEKIESGEMKELSCGYDCDIQDEENPQQRNIRGNHLALCEKGRAGIAKIVDSVDDSIKDSDLFVGKEFTSPKGVKFKILEVKSSFSDYDGEPFIVVKYKVDIPGDKSFVESNAVQTFFKYITGYYDKYVKDSIKDVEPRKGETKEEFLSRFMKETKEEYPDEKQRYAVANSYWNKQHDSIKDREFKHNIFGFINGTMQEFNPSDLVEKVKQRRESLHTNRIVRDDDNYKCMYHIVVEVFGGYDLETCRVYVDIVKESWFRNTDYDADDYRHYQGKTYQDRVLSQNCGDGPDKWDKAISVLNSFKSKHLRDSIKDSDNLDDWFDELYYNSISYQFINGGYGMKFGDYESYLKAKQLAKKVNYTKGTWDDKKMTHFNFSSVMIGNDSIEDSDDLRKLAENYGLKYEDLLKQFQNLIRKGINREEALRMVKENVESIIMDSKNEFDTDSLDCEDECGKKEDSIKDEPTWFKELAIEAKDYYKKQQKDVSWTDIANYIKSKTKGYGLMQISWWIDDFSKKNPNFLKDSVKDSIPEGIKDVVKLVKHLKSDSKVKSKDSDQTDVLNDIVKHLKSDSKVKSKDYELNLNPAKLSQVINEIKSSYPWLNYKINKTWKDENGYIGGFPGAIYYDITLYGKIDLKNNKNDFYSQKEEHDKILSNMLRKIRKIGAKYNLSGNTKAVCFRSEEDGRPTWETIKIGMVFELVYDKEKAEQELKRIKNSYDSLSSKDQNSIKTKDEEDIKIGYYTKKDKGYFMPIVYCYEVHEINGDEVKFSESVYEYEKHRRFFAMKNGTTDIKTFKKWIKGYKKSDSYKY